MNLAGINIADVIVSLIILAVVGAGIFYIVRAKKSGKACIGCPSSGECKKCNCMDSKNNDHK